jgi:hypothetical protein
MPLPNICIFCWGDAKHVAVWRYGSNWTCFTGDCILRTKRMIGFHGLYPSQSQADAAIYQINLLRKEKERNRGRRTTKR